MPQITAYANKTNLERWQRVQRKADVIKWLLDRYEAGDIELETKQTNPRVFKNPRSIAKSDDEHIELKTTKGGPGAPLTEKMLDREFKKARDAGTPMAKQIIKTPDDAKKAVGSAHQNFFKKPKKK